MAPFDQLNIIIASVVGGVALLYIIFASIIHHSFKVRLQSGDGLEVYRDTAKRKETSALDNRKRIYYTTEPCTRTDCNHDGCTPSGTYTYYTPGWNTMTLYNRPRCTVSYQGPCNTLNDVGNTNTQCQVNADSPDTYNIVTAKCVKKSSSGSCSRTNAGSYSTCSCSGTYTGGPHSCKDNNVCNMSGCTCTKVPKGTYSTCSPGYDYYP